MWKINIILFLLFVNFYINFSKADEESLEEEWHSGTCKKGKYQSPIALDKSKSKSSDKKVTWLYDDDASSIALGHLNVSKRGVRFTYELDKEDQIKELNNFQVDLDGMKYQLRIMGVNWPSEHQVNGQTYDLELQVLYKHGDKHSLIISYLMNVCEDDNKAMDLEPFPSAEDEEANVNPHNFAVKLNCPWFIYHGSLTSPPCSEDVMRMVFDPNDEAAPCVKQSQMEELRQLTYRGQSVGGNNRPLQKLNGRTIEYNNKKCNVK